MSRPKHEPLSDEVANALLGAIEDGVTVRRWFEMYAPEGVVYGQYAARRRADPAFVEAVDQARETGCEALIEDAVENQLLAGNDHRAAAGASRMASTMFKAAEMLAPKRFSPKLQHTGPDGDALTIQVVHHDLVASTPAKALDVVGSPGKALLSQATDQATDDGSDNS